MFCRSWCGHGGAQGHRCVHGKLRCPPDRALRASGGRLRRAGVDAECSSSILSADGRTLRLTGYRRFAQRVIRNSIWLDTCRGAQYPNGAPLAGCWNTFQVRRGFQTCWPAARLCRESGDGWTYSGVSADGTSRTIQTTPAGDPVPPTPRGLLTLMRVLAVAATDVTSLPGAGRPGCRISPHPSHPRRPDQLTSRAAIADHALKLRAANQNRYPRRIATRGAYWAAHREPAIAAY